MTLLNRVSTQELLGAVVVTVGIMLLLEPTGSPRPDQCERLS